MMFWQKISCLLYAAIDVPHQQSVEHLAAVSLDACARSYIMICTGHQSPLPLRNTLGVSAQSALDARKTREHQHDAVEQQIASQTETQHGFLALQRAGMRRPRRKGSRPTAMRAALHPACPGGIPLEPMKPCHSQPLVSRMEGEQTRSSRLVPLAVHRVG